MLGSPRASYAFLLSVGRSSTRALCRQFLLLRCQANNCVDFCHGQRREFAHFVKCHYSLSPLRIADASNVLLCNVRKPKQARRLAAKRCLFSSIMHKCGVRDKTLSPFHISKVSRTPFLWRCQVKFLKDCMVLAVED